MVNHYLLVTNIIKLITLLKYTLHGHLPFWCTTFPYLFWYNQNIIYMFYATDNYRGILHYHLPASFGKFLTILISCRDFQTEKSVNILKRIVSNGYSYTFQLFNKKELLFSEESCSVIGLSEKVGFQLRSELLATVVW